MTSRALDREFERQVIAHMNADHADAVLAYVNVLSGLPDATQATLVAIDLDAMIVKTDLPPPHDEVRIALDPEPDGAAQVRAALVAMAKRART